MKRQFWAILVAATLAIAASNASAVLQIMSFSGDGETGGDAYDNYIRSSGSLNNHGHQPTTMAGEPNGYRTMLRFDVSALAGQYVSIDSIELRLNQVGGGAGVVVDAHRISDANSNWQEGFDHTSWTSWGGWWNRSTWSTKLRGTADGSWVGDGGGDGLGQPGGTGYSILPIATGTSNGSGSMSMFFTGNLAALVDDWSLSPVQGRTEGRFTVGNPGVFENVENEGMLIRADAFIEWSSSEHGISPELIVTYDDGLAPVVPGDVDEDTDVDADDIDMMGDHIRTSTPPTGANYDLTGFDEFGNPDPEGGYPDGVVDLLDLDYLIRSLVTTDLGPGSEYGDFNLDGLVDTTDLTRLATNYGVGTMWAEGNANRNFDLLIDTTDLTILATFFGFDRSADAIPEPMTLSLLALGGAALIRRRK